MSKIPGKGRKIRLLLTLLSALQTIVCSMPARHHYPVTTGESAWRGKPWQEQTTSLSNISTSKCFPIKRNAHRSRFSIKTRPTWKTTTQSLNVSLQLCTVSKTNATNKWPMDWRFWWFHHLIHSYYYLQMQLAHIFLLAGLVGLSSQQRFVLGAPNSGSKFIQTVCWIFLPTFIRSIHADLMIFLFSRLTFNCD